MMKYITISVAILAITILTIGLNPIYAQQKSIIKYEQDFDNDTLKTFDNLFEDCPVGTVVYKLNGELIVICLIDSVHGILVNHDGTTNINIHVDKKDKSNHHHDKKDNNNDGPDKSCLFDVYQSKCAPNKDGECPDGFNLNEDERCFPDHHEDGCPDGYHGVDDDETGQCYKDDDGCPDGMELKDGNCRYIPEEDNTDTDPLPPVVTPEVTQSDTSDNEEKQPVSTNDNDQKESENGDEQAEVDQIVKEYSEEDNN